VGIRLEWKYTKKNSSAATGSIRFTPETATKAEAIIADKKFPIREGTLAFVPAGTVHNFINTGKTDLKLFTTYSPPNHAAGILQKSKTD
jgi:mannose-6-phosphate isomerase-like protein (cupin superfamily)